MKLKIIIIAVLVLGLLIFGVVKMTGNAIKSEQVTIRTNLGDIVLELYPQKAPITVANFKSYVEEGFYSNTIFHRVISGFMIQGGGIDVSGEEKETHSSIKLESNNGLLNKRGTIAMARTNVPDSATSQFFINVADNDFLNYGYRDEGYAVFGKVIEGMDVVDEIAKVKTDSNDMPLQNIVIEEVIIS